MIRLKAVKTWISKKNPKTQKEIASCFNIHPRTLRRWIRLYRSGGQENLRRLHQSPWNRFDPDIEENAAHLKEKKPWLTLLETQKILRKKGIEISKRGIWSIWKRFGLGGFVKGEFSFNYTDYITLTKEASFDLKTAIRVFKKGEIKEAARIMNSMPSCPNNHLLEKIPDRLLSLPKRIEKLHLLFGKIPFRKQKMKARKLREQAEKKRLLYFAIRAGIMEAIALDWLQEAKTMLTLINRLKNFIKKNGKRKLSGDPALRLSLSFLEGEALVKLMRIKDALRCARDCQIIVIRSFPSSLKARYNLAALFISIGYLYDGLKIFNHPGLKREPVIQFRIASILAITGEYRKSLSLIRSIEPKLNERLSSQSMQVYAICYLGQGKISQAARSLQLATEYAKKATIRGDFHTGTLLLAACYAANRDNFNAKILIKKFIPVLKKLGTRRDLIMRYIILGEDLKIDEENLTPTHKLALLLKKTQEYLRVKDYRRAYKYAISKGIVSHLHVLLLFFPEPVRKLLEKGKSTGLPKALLKLPVFNQDIPVYNVKCLGDLSIYKNQKYVRIKLPPKDTAFLIHFALRAGEPKKEIPLENIYNNFWKNSNNPARNLSHLLVRIKKAFKIPSHLIEVSYKKDNPVLINKGIHFITDYDELQQDLAQAKALEQAGEWGFAKEEYLRAFNLFRGEPFRKMYDNWSEHMRRVILNKIESDVTSFTKSCLKHKNKKDAQKVFAKISKIIFYAEGKKKQLAI